MIRIGIIGCGSTIGIAKNHIQAYLCCRDAVITALYDLEPERAESYIAQFGLTEAKACRSLEELLESCDAVSICALKA